MLQKHGLQKRGLQSGAGPPRPGTATLAESVGTRTGLCRDPCCNRSSAVPGLAGTAKNATAPCRGLCHCRRVPEGGASAGESDGSPAAAAALRRQWCPGTTDQRCPCPRRANRLAAHVSAAHPSRNNARPSASDGRHFEPTACLLPRAAVARCPPAGNEPPTPALPDWSMLARRMLLGAANCRHA